MDRFDYQHLDGLIIEANKGAIRIDYSEPDQGGTQLLIRFRIFLDGRVERDNGYAHDNKLQTEEIALDKVPSRVVTDALSWIQEQKGIGAGNSKLIEVLNRFETVISS